MSVLNYGPFLYELSFFFRREMTRTAKFSNHDFSDIAAKDPDQHISLVTLHRESAQPKKCLIYICQ